MRISARNVLKGKIKSVKRGAVNGEVTLQVAPGVEVVSIITLESVKALGLRKGKDAYAVIKASDVMVGTSHHKHGG
jgi:molybdopterin-binding protein